MEKVLNQRELPLISLDELMKLEYAKEDALPRESDRRVRRGNLDKALALGKIPSMTTHLVVHTQNGYKRLTGAIHFVNDKGITLEHDHFIPMSAIYSVDFT